MDITLSKKKSVKSWQPAIFINFIDYNYLTNWIP